MPRSWRLRNRKGERHGRLVVLERDSNRNDRVFWKCRCDCGNAVSVVAGNLGRCTFSCGCLRAETGKTHGLGNYEVPEYRSWRAMMQRCGSPKHSEYKHYGGRGIKVCERWQGVNGFPNFLADMGQRPTLLHSIDRINNEGPYSPENCRWSTRKEQASNTRVNHRITYAGVTRTLTEWAEYLGMSPITLNTRISRNWPISRALTAPVQIKRNRRASP